MCIYEKYQIIQTLGQGTFGKVKLASHNGQLFAIKFSTKSNAYSQQVLEGIFEKQSSILTELDHPNIIKLYETVKDGLYQKANSSESRSALVFEYAPNNLGEILEFGALPETIARTLFHQMISALSYLHSKNIIHRDIKPQNILFDEHYNIKIADFGLSAKVTNDNKPKTICGSDSFKSPELLMRKNYNGIMNDLFAAGVTLFILVSAKAPFVSATPNNGFYKFIALNYIDKFWSSHEKKSKFSPKLKDLLNSMFAFDPTHRLSISEILCHPWMTGDVLMGEDLELEMRKIEMEIVQKKRKNMLKNLQGKPIQMNKNAHRSFLQTVELGKEIAKRKYRTDLAKLSDRFVPLLKNYGDLQKLLQFLEGDLKINGEQIELTKIINGQTSEKLTIQISVQNIDEESDCLKFKLKEGDIIEYVETLKLFDSKLMA